MSKKEELLLHSLELRDNFYSWDADRIRSAILKIIKLRLTSVETVLNSWEKSQIYESIEYVSANFLGDQDRKSWLALSLNCLGMSFAKNISPSTLSSSFVRQFDHLEQRSLLQALETKVCGKFDLNTV